MRQIGADAREKRAHQLRHSAAHHDHVGLQQIHDIPQPHRQQKRSLRKDLASHRIAFAEGRADVLRLHLLDASGQSLLSPGESLLASGQFLLDRIPDECGRR